jgi:hypothetical protein
MPLVAYSCTAPSPAIVALEVLAKLQSVEVTFGSSDSPALEVVTKHPITGESTNKSVAWVGCARTLSQIVPSLTLWEGAQVESWVESAANSVIPALESGELQTCTPRGMSIMVVKFLFTFIYFPL